MIRQSIIQTQNLTDTLNILEKRHKDTYFLKGLNSLNVDGDELMLEFDVIDTDENLNKMSRVGYSKEFYMPDYVWGHLAGFLEIPQKLIDYYRALTRLPYRDFQKARENAGENLVMLFNARLDKQRSNRRIKDIYLTVFDDVFGEFPRVIHSDLYYPFRDSDALETIESGVDTINVRTGQDYVFKNAYISPYQSSFNYVDTQSDVSKVSITEYGDEIQSGFVMKNSECKHASLVFQALVLRMVCTNGLIAQTRGNDFRVKHYENGFERKMQAAFSKTLMLEDKFASYYMKSLKYDSEVISPSWADLVELPSKYLEARKHEKMELIEIAKKQKYRFTPRNIVETLTYKASHVDKTDAERERTNKKALHVLDNIELIASWHPEYVQTQVN